ncbi:hypothetical protein A2810_01020 [candidate division Kazan bacterium RIFCSPHIGHO2_01_FULL_49_10]|uniref:Uncharacterized protein n=1 Tax=candidate division Kazan bacterium RIFCSPLOWO2_01_FULL_48_13 TaxID=1798539 RepID=A0A1F4PPK9_UNCK3|nr:MAG: hypothetical protein A2810_01020 [candidate division Kazan bacterium RIFCSPHIGHO2_01_FULL_49_10]OGB85520.1 MAG: hypothetical protein A2994_00650 [candidate division Kazan bacterium RIFCSPLOWO2_01_FULL_48_13]
MSLLHLFKISYYFDPVVSYDFPGFWVVVVLLAAALMFSVWFGRTIAHRKNLSGHVREFWQGWVNLGGTLSIVGLIYLFFRFENLMYVNWRLWPALLILYVIGRSLYLIYVYKKVLPKRAAEKESRKMMSYYFRRRQRK